MGCEGGVSVLSLCSPRATTLIQQQHQEQHQQQQYQHQQYYQCSSTSLLTGVIGFGEAAGSPGPAEEVIGKTACDEGPVEGGTTMVVLTWKGRSVTAHHIPQPRPHVTPPPATNIHRHNEKKGSSHNGGEHSSSSSGSSSGSIGATDDKELGAFWEILDREIRPLPPLANSPDSQQIFNDHKDMARNYLVLQQELFNLRKCKSDLEGKLSEAEQLEQMNNHRYQDKIRQLEGKRESLRNNHKHLRQQLELIRSQAARAAAHNASLHHPPP